MFLILLNSFIHGMHMLAFFHVCDQLEYIRIYTRSSYLFVSSATMRILSISAHSIPSKIKTVKNTYFRWTANETVVMKQANIWCWAVIFSYNILVSRNACIHNTHKQNGNGFTFRFSSLLKRCWIKHQQRQMITNRTVGIWKWREHKI